MNLNEFFESLNIEFNGRILRYHDFVAEVCDVKNSGFLEYIVEVKGVFPIFGNKKESNITIYADIGNNKCRIEQGRFYIDLEEEFNELDFDLDLYNKFDMHAELEIFEKELIVQIDKRKDTIVEAYRKIRDDVESRKKDIKDSKLIYELFKNSSYKTGIIKDYIEYNCGGSDGYGSGDYTITNLRQAVLGMLKIASKSVDIINYSVFPRFETLEQMEEACIIQNTSFTIPELNYDCGLPVLFNNGIYFPSFFNIEIFEGLKIEDIVHYPEYLFPFPDEIEGATLTKIEKINVPETNDEDLEIWRNERSYYDIVF